MNKTFALATVKSLDDADPVGQFEAILSAPTLDRDGEVVDAKAFEPLPASIPVHAFHDFHDPIGRGVPSYEGDVLVLRGKFASTPRAQEIRSLVAEGIIANMSVGFMSATTAVKDGVPHITNGEILEGSFVSIPSNRESAVLMAKEYVAKAGARNSKADAETIQAAHDLLNSLGATCAAVEPEKSTAPPEKAAAPAAAHSPADVGGLANAKARVTDAFAMAALLDA